jgi:GTPase
MVFIDEAVIYIRSGKGGDGMVHFHREKYVPRGGPDGGDGGRGGDVILLATHSMNTLAVFRHVSRFSAKEGGNGGPSNRSGKKADALYIKVPVGTMVYDRDSGKLLGDLVESGQELLVGKGGRYGRGNQHYATASNQAPTMAEKGEPSEEKHLRLELRLIADVGIIGVPNAGKSSLLAAVTNANPKIGDYPFTTLDPVLGVTELDDDTTLVLADIPGLIEGAHAGAGLGTSFLRHIQRTRVLIHLLDGLSTDPLADFSQVNSELAYFDPGLAHKPQIVAFNKIDQPEVMERWPEIEKELKARGLEPLAISTASRTNLQPLLWKAFELLKTVPQPGPETTDLPVYRPEEDEKAFSIQRTNEGWKVTGAAIERAAAMTYWEHEGSVRRFQRMMVKLGVDEALRKTGVVNGDTVFVGEYELEWSD